MEGTGISMTTRRHFNQLLGPGLSAAQARPDPSESRRPLKIVCVGAHPDDPESGCGGTLARYAELGHRVTVLYLTRGERGIPRQSYPEKAALFAHRRQNGEEIYHKHHEVMENYRGREAGVAAAEAFVHLAREGTASKLPGL